MRPPVPSCRRSMGRTTTWPTSSPTPRTRSRPVSSFPSGTRARGGRQRGPDSHWVHDDMEVSAVAFQEQGTRKTTVVMASNLYMIFGTDGDVIRDRVAEQLGRRADPGGAGDLRRPQPPRPGHGVRRQPRVVRADDAPGHRRSGRGDSRHAPGASRSPRPSTTSASLTVATRRCSTRTLGVLKATATNGRTIATMLFWANHPETTLFWQPPNDAILDECAEIGLTPCTFEDRYFTADYPGWATRILEAELGGEALFFNGAIGDLVTPLGANVWEVDSSAPLGLGLVPPPGAAAARGEQLPGAELPPRLSDRSRAGDRRARGARLGRAGDGADRRLRRHVVLHACRTSGSGCCWCAAKTA